MRNKMILAVIGILMVGIVGCSNNNGKLSGKIYNEINEVYNRVFNMDFRYDRYYGSYSGGYVFFIESDDARMKTVIIDGLSFSGGSSWSLILYSNESFYNIEEYEILLKDNLLTHDDLMEIHSVHIKFYGGSL